MFFLVCHFRMYAWVSCLGNCSYGWLPEELLSPSSLLKTQLAFVNWQYKKEFINLLFCLLWIFTWEIPFKSNNRNSIASWKKQFFFSLMINQSFKLTLVLLSLVLVTNLVSESNSLYFSVWAGPPGWDVCVQFVQYPIPRPSWLLTYYSIFHHHTL